MPDFTLPEFTRSLRALAVPSVSGSEHDLVLAPLIQARGAANRVSGVEARVAAFDADRLEREWRAAIASFATERQPRSAPDQRALVAELEALAAPLWVALAALREAAGVVRSAKVDRRESAWEHWVSAVQQVFHAADDWWRTAVPVLGEARARGGRWWQSRLGIS